MTAAALIVTGAGAHASEACTFGFCSQIHNAGPTDAMAVRTWVCDGGTTGTETENRGCVAGESRRLPTGRSTPGSQDWDTLRIDAGWCYKVRLHVPFKTWTLHYDRRRTGPSWVKVESYGAATVLARSMRSCP